MELTVERVTDKSKLREYIHLPQKLYASDSRWVPPLYADEWNFHDQSKNAALAYADVIRLILYDGRRPVGRIMGIINRKYNDQHQEKTARFFNLDCIDDPLAAATLIREIEVWAREMGMNKLIGPYGFSDKDPQGMQIEGFDHLPVIATPTNPPYLKHLVEELGFTKEIDCVSYRLPMHEVLPPLIEKIYNRIISQGLVRLMEFKTKRQLKPYIVPVFRLVNETYKHLFGFVPMSEEEIYRFAAQYLPVLDPTFVKIVVDGNNQPIAFVVAMPDMSRGIQKAKGKLFPVGFVHILLAMKKATQLDLLLGCVSTRHRGRGITTLLAKSLYATARKRGIKYFDSHLILENNQLMRAECENVNGEVYKRYRIYQKLI